eukprot:gnl/TRDRNA2_/TRDRNA2_168325_c3_seq1.p1 gnl/TRDRNA2_/TRDRNA2_168325_c3~~gnl/TRDRNA2_/TRDRNA2_168325_c3_seq1.p1  ORF type:complete len:354 (-),score=52.73 gnl/TRDRNA2_/TRDRNA2_168325_c3_seq1:254-1246(-)
MLGAVRFQLVSLLAGSGAEFLIGVAETGATTYIDWKVNEVMLEIEASRKLVQLVRGFCEHLQKYSEQTTRAMRDRLVKIEADIDATDSLLKEAEAALECPATLKQELLSWVAIGDVTKLGLEQLIEELDKLEKDISAEMKKMIDGFKESFIQSHELALEQVRADVADTKQDLIQNVWAWFVSGVCETFADGGCADRLAAIEEHSRTAQLYRKGYLELFERRRDCHKLCAQCKMLLEETNCLLKASRGASEATSYELMNQLCAKMMDEGTSSKTGQSLGICLAACIEKLWGPLEENDQAMPFCLNRRQQQPSTTDVDPTTDWLHQTIFPSY